VNVTKLINLLKEHKAPMDDDNDRKLRELADKLIMPNLNLATFDFEDISLEDIKFLKEHNEVLDERYATYAKMQIIFKAIPRRNSDTEDFI